MTAKTELSAPKRRTRTEVQQLVAEFVRSGMRRSEFCQSRGLSFSTLDRHLKKRRWKRRRRPRRPTSSAGRLVPVELAARKSPTQQEPGEDDGTRTEIRGWVAAIMRFSSLLFRQASACPRSPRFDDRTSVSVRERIFEGRKLAPRSSCVASFCTCCPTGSFASVTSGFSPIAFGFPSGVGPTTVGLQLLDGAGSWNTRRALRDLFSLALPALRRIDDRDSEIYGCGFISMRVLRFFLTHPSVAELGGARARRVPTLSKPPVPLPSLSPVCGSAAHRDGTFNLPRWPSIAHLVAKLAFKSHSSPRPPQTPAPSS
jgi:hypothetical protein